MGRQHAGGDISAGGKRIRQTDTLDEKWWYSNLLTWRLNSQLRHAGLDPEPSVFLDSRLRGNDNCRVFNRRSNVL